MKALRAILILLVVAALGAAAFFYISRPDRHAAPGVYAGYAEGEFVYVSSPIGGQLEELSVRRGDQTTQGAPLFSLEHAQEAAARAEAEETLRESRTRMEKAKLDFDRARNLRDKRVISPEDYDAAEQTWLAAQHTVAARQRALEQADWRLSQKRQPSPAAGLVYDTFFRKGEWVPGGAPVAALLPPEYLKVRFFVPESDLGKLPVGSRVTVGMDGLPAGLPATISYVSPRAEYTLPIIYSRENKGKLVFLVEASLLPADAVKLHPGAPVSVQLAAAP